MAWWQENVRRPGGDRQSEEAFLRDGNNALSVPHAEEETEITKPQVCRQEG